MLDLVRRAGGSGGLVRPDQPGVVGWPARVPRRVAGWSSSRTSRSSRSEGGDALLALLDRHPHVIATLSGHTHRNLIAPRQTAAGGYWQISTASLIDYPQQARALRFVATAGGGSRSRPGCSTTYLPGQIGKFSRELSYIDAQGGRPKGFTGAASTAMSRCTAAGREPREPPAGE